MRTAIVKIDPTTPMRRFAVDNIPLMNDSAFIKVYAVREMDNHCSQTINYWETRYLDEDDDPIAPNEAVIAESLFNIGRTGYVLKMRFDLTSAADLDRLHAFANFRHVTMPFVTRQRNHTHIRTAIAAIKPDHPWRIPR